MRRVLATAAVTGLLLFGAAPAFAASPSQTECEAAGGTFVRSGGQLSCTIVDPVANSENPGGKSQTRDDTAESNGTLNNEAQASECASGPGNQTTCP